jgi:DNA polymerase-3 subunit alpha
MEGGPGGDVGFVHLHTHSQFSILDATATVGALAKRAAELGMSALALTDTCNLYGAVAFVKACKGAGIKAVLGAELHVTHEGLEGRGRGVEAGYQVVALVENPTGYGHLCELVTRAIFDGMDHKPLVTVEALRQHHEGLIFLTGGVKGVLGRALREGDTGLAEARFHELSSFLGPDQLYLELQDHGIEGQEEVNQLARRLSAATGRPLVATNAVHYLQPHDAAIHEVLTSIGSGTSLADPQRIRTDTDQAFLKSEEEMRELFPDDLDAIERTVEIAERCNYMFDFDTYHFPATTPPDVAEDGSQPDTDANWAYFYAAFPPPRDYGMPDPEERIPERPEGAGNINGYFKWYAKEGLRLRLEDVDEALHPEYDARLERELDIVIGMGFPAYLLIVAEFINWSKDNEIPVGPGRGSAAGSLAAWAMRITDIDPIRYGLLFERFLNPERVSMPDIDVDFCQDRREEAIEHVRVKYGAPLVSQIITYGTLKAKAAIRDVARVLDLNFNEADRIAKLVPDQLGIKLAEALEAEPRLAALREGDPKVRRVLDVAMAVEGTMRQTGVHAAGVVIADQPLVRYAPLYRDEPEGGPVVQYDMKSAESIGLIKFDFLGLKTLDQIRDAVKFVQANHGVQIDMSRIPVDDEATYALLQEGDALGVFQLESSGMRELLTRLQPDCVDDMVALVALYRPGPLQSGMTDEFVERKHGRVKVSYPLPILEPILKGTYGTIIYQEQVMQIAQVMAGYSLGEADLLRRAMGKKKKEEMDKQKVRFVSGSIDNGIDEEKAVEIFEMMAKFAAYGFNKSHSAAYGYISYQTAWLKAHYRPEYMAALMTIEAANTDKVLTYVLDCREAGIRIEPVCLNHSERWFSVPPPGERPVEDGEPVDIIRFGLAAVKNVGSSAVESLLQSRKEAGGSFSSVEQLFELIDYRVVNRRVLENLIKAGALDFTGHHRSALFGGLDAAMTLGARAQRDKASGQIGLFGAVAAAKPTRLRLPDVPEWPLSEKLGYEREVLGLYLTGHPMQAHGRDIARYASASLSELSEVQGEEVRVLAMVSDVRTINAKGRRDSKMAFVRIEDEHASVECVFFPQAWARSARALEAGEPVLVTGKLEHGEEVKIMGSSAEPLTEVRSRTTREVRMMFDVAELAGKRLQQLREILVAQSGGCRTRLILRSEGRYEAELLLPELPVEPSARLEESVHALFDRNDIVALA